MAYTHDIVHQIWNDDTGERIEVGPDMDGLALFEIRYVDKDDKVGNRVVMTEQEAMAVYEALGMLLKP